MVRLAISASGRLAALFAGLRNAAVVFPSGMPAYDGWSGLAHERGEMAAIARDWACVGMDLSASAERVAERRGLPKASALEPHPAA